VPDVQQAHAIFMHPLLPTEHSKLHSKLAGRALTHMQLYPATAEHYAPAARRKERGGQVNNA
jgi:hypothetical protein